MNNCISSQNKIQCSRFYYFVTELEYTTPYITKSRYKKNISIWKCQIIKSTGVVIKLHGAFLPFASSYQLAQSLKLVCNFLNIIILLMHILLENKNESMPQQMDVCVIFLFQHRYSLTHLSRIVDTTVDVMGGLSVTLIMVWPGFVNRARIIHQSGTVTIMILHMLGQQTVSLAARKISRRLESRWIYSISLLDYSKFAN